MYPVGTKFAGCDGGPNRNLGLPAGWGSGKHMEGGPGQGKLTGQRDWLASAASMGTKAGQSTEVPHDEVRSRGCLSMGVKARVATISLIQGKIWEEVQLQGSEGRHRAKKGPEPEFMFPSFSD